MLAKKAFRMSKIYLIPNETELENLAKKISLSLSDNRLVYLTGELGAGKTTFTRGMLRGLGYQGLVKSPTFTIVEVYNLAGLVVNHFDLYRLNSSSELFEIGFSDYLSENSLVIIEWADKFELPKPDLDVIISYHSKGRKVEINYRL